MGRHKGVFNHLDVIGQRFGMRKIIGFLRVEERPLPHRKQIDYVYEALCDCGKKFEVSRRTLFEATRHTGPQSCGCQQTQAICKAATAAWKGHGDLSGSMFSHIRAHAKTRSLPFEITIKQAWDQWEKQNHRCALSGQELCIYHPNSQRVGSCAKRTASLDRIDSTKGYTPNNIQWIHKRIQRMKWNLPEQEFIGHCQKIAEYQSKSKP